MLYVLKGMNDTMNLLVLFMIWDLSRSPLDKCFKLKSLTILVEMVPLPEPGGPIIIALNNLDIILPI